MERVSTAEAAQRKRCSRQSIFNAIHRGKISAQRIGRSYVVSVDEKFRNWRPNLRRQEIGRDSQRTKE